MAYDDVRVRHNGGNVDDVDGKGGRGEEPMALPSQRETKSRELDTPWGVTMKRIQP